MGTMGTLLDRFDSMPIMEFLLFVTMTAAIFLLIYMQCKKDALDLRWLILDDTNGRPSIHKIGQGLALIVSTWGFIYQITHDKFNDNYLLIYMGVWAGSTALNQFLVSKAGGITSTSTTIVSQTTEQDK